MYSPKLTRLISYVPSLKHNPPSYSHILFFSVPLSYPSPLPPLLLPPSPPGIKYKNIPKDRAPFDFAQSKKTFIREVVNFRPAYGRQANHGEESIAFDASVGRDGITQIDSASLFSQENSMELSEKAMAKTATLPYKSGMLKRAMARGGPARFRKKINLMKEDAMLDATGARTTSAGGSNSPLSRLRDKGDHAISLYDIPIRCNHDFPIHDLSMQPFHATSQHTSPSNYPHYRHFISTQIVLSKIGILPRWICC